MATEPVIDILHRADDGVGESLRWIEEDHALLWVDITGRAIKRLEVRTGRYEEWPTPGFPAAIVPRQRGGAVVAIGRCVTLFNFGDRFDTLVTPEPNHPENRLNEAAADPQGRLWVGTMQNNIAADGTPQSIEGRKGSLYRIEASGECRRACDDAFAITNTLVWRDRTMITADTLAGELYAYDYEPAAGHIGNRRLFAAEPGYPDGSCLDAEGYLWNARFGDGCLIRFDTQGQLDRVVRLPVRNPTSCCFGGDGLRTLFVTSARFGLEPEYLSGHPNEGAVLSLDAGVTGARTHRFAG
jgi:sugar lactone lactonase YvrE